MSRLHDYSEQISEKSLANSEKDVEIDSTDDAESPPPDNHQKATETSGDRTLMLMDLDNGLVGWESEEDPENPQ